MSGADFRHDSRQHWSDSAKSWARAAEEEEVGASAKATGWMLDTAGLEPGERVLELACGAGRVGLEAAAAVEPGGTVLCSDFSEAMVEAVRERLARSGIANVEAQVLDAESLDLDGREPFDVVLCRFGYMLMADPSQALRETARVLRPDGRLVLAVWGPAETNPWLATIFEATMSHLNAPPPEPGTPGPFALGEKERLRRTIEAAGLADVSVVEIEAEQTYDSLEAWWEQIRSVSGPLDALLHALPEADVAAIRDGAIAAAQNHAKGDGTAVFPATIVGAEARRPSST